MAGTDGAPVGIHSDLTGLTCGIVDAERDGAAITWDDVTQILTLTHSADYSYYVAGKHFDATADKTIDISGSIAEGWWYFWFGADGELAASQTFPGISSAYALVAFIYWDATNAKALGVYEERHGVVMDVATHKYLHDSLRTVYEKGLALTHNALATGNPANDTSSKVWLTGGEIHDEDLEIEILNGAGGAVFEQVLGSDLASAAALLPMWYRDGTGVWRVWDNDSDRFAFHHGGGNTRPSYNQYSAPNWSLTECTATRHVVYFICFSTELSNPVFLIPSDDQYATLDAAEAVSAADINWISAPFKEVIVAYKLIYQASNGYTNATHRAVLRQVADTRSIFASQILAQSSFAHSALDNLDYANAGHTNFQRKTHESAASDPSGDNDAIDTAGLGNTFAAGDRWVNLTSDVSFVCKDA